MHAAQPQSYDEGEDYDEGGYDEEGYDEEAYDEESSEEEVYDEASDPDEYTSGVGAWNPGMEAATPYLMIAGFAGLAMLLGSMGKRR